MPDRDPAAVERLSHASPPGRLHCVTGLIHLLPLPRVLGGQTLAKPYGVDIANADLMLLLRHRAVLFGLMGGFMVLAAWRTALLPYAFAAGWISVVSFLLLAGLGGPHSAAIQRVVMARLDRACGA